MKPLKNKIAVVAGATRGAGRGIACALGEAGALVYCTGRSVRGKRVKKRGKGQWSAFDLSTRAETIEDTAEMVTRRGGKGIAVRVDHTDEAQVRKLFQKVKREQGRLDILVNDVWGGDMLTEWGKPFWELDLEKGFLMMERAVNSHIITSRYAAPLIIKQKSGLIIEITDGDKLYYRGTLFYDLVKTTAIRLAFVMAHELRKHRVASIAVTPGFLRSEAMLDYFGVTESNWRDAIKKEPSFAESETPLYVGRAIAALAADPKVFEKSGRTFSSWTLAREYAFTDSDGRRPDFGKYFEEKGGDFFEEMRDSHKNFLKGFE